MGHQGGRNSRLPPTPLDGRHRQGVATAALRKEGGWAVVGKGYRHCSGVAEHSGAKLTMSTLYLGWDGGQLACHLAGQRWLPAPCGNRPPRSVTTTPRTHHSHPATPCVCGHFGSRLGRLPAREKEIFSPLRSAVSRYLRKRVSHGQSFPPPAVSPKPTCS